MPVFNHKELLDRLMGDKDLAVSVLDVFLSDIHRQIQLLKELVESENIPEISRQAHSIKGSSANVGAGVMRELAFGLEKAGKAGDLDFVKEGMSELEVQYDLLKEEINKVM